MFSPALGRAFRSASAIAAAPAPPLGRAALSTAPQPFRPAQRRLSSSKPSVPADNSKRSTKNTAENAAETAVEKPKAESKKAMQKKPKGSASAAAAVPARNIPYVRPTSHLTDDNMKLVTLLAQHRPISITQEVPTPLSMAQFDEIFKPRTEAQTIMENERTLGNFIQSMVNQAQSYEEMDMLEEAAEEQIHHLDSLRPSQDSVEDFMSQCYAFVPPPAPVPTTKAAAPAREITLPTTHTGRSRAFREHVVSRRRPGMLLISVKRQRKLKMKKHKYKKLMKRTRLLRRKLDRL